MDPEKPTPATDPGPAWREPFYEPQTIPAGWDLSAMFAGPAPEVGDEVAQKED